METRKMPVLFVGHGSPMNAIEDNRYTKTWKEIARKIEKPKAILSISAHWYTNGTKIQDSEAPETIHDMYGFPDALYEISYDAKGAPEFSKTTRELISRKVDVDNSWGIDHGTWSVLTHMFPNHDVPVFQLSIDAHASPEVHFNIGKELVSLREQGILIMGSGNVVHNLHRIDWEMEDKGNPWAMEFDKAMKTAIIERRYQDVIDYKSLGGIASLAVPTPEHFFPLLYVLGTLSGSDEVSVFNEGCAVGSLSMTCYLFEEES